MEMRYKVFDAQTGEPLSHLERIADAVMVAASYSPREVAILDTYTGTVLT